MPRDIRPKTHTRAPPPLRILPSSARLLGCLWLELDPDQKAARVDREAIRAAFSRWRDRRSSVAAPLPLWPFAAGSRRNAQATKRVSRHRLRRRTDRKDPWQEVERAEVATR